MPTAIGTRLARAATLLCFTLVAGTAESQLVITKQVLDRVEAFNATTVLEMPFDDPNRTADFFNTGIAGTSIVACKLTAIDGLYCLDGKVLRRWANTLNPGIFVNELNCADSKLGLDSKKTDTCTGMTVALSGDIYLAGRKGTTFSLIKVIPKPGSGCGAFTELTGGKYCAQEQYSGRPQLIDVDRIDGETGEAFTYGPGVLGLEEKKTVSFFPDTKPANGAPIIIANSQAWGLNGNEQLLSTSLLQIPDGGSFQNFVLVTTSSGRILAKRTDQAGSAFQVFTIPNGRLPSSTQCNADTQQYEVRTSPKTGRVYVTDRNYCQVMALVPNGLPFTSLANEGEPDDLTLLTADNSETNPPTGATLAPGISIDLKDCSVNCNIVENEQGDVGAKLVAVKLNTGSSSNATAFLVKGIPDCRYPDELPPELQPTCIEHPEAVVDPDNVGNPAAQLLNVTPLLPQEILKLYDTSGIPPAGLPPLLISRQYRAQERNDFVFEAFFFVTEPGVHFAGSFTAEFDVPVLEGAPPNSSLGCVPDPNNLLAWDISTNVSELYRSTNVVGDSQGDYVDTLTNIGCGSSKTQQIRISLLPYNLEVNPDTYGPTIDFPNTKLVTLGNDAVFARLVQNLYDDLEFVRRELACKLADYPSGQPPISASVCNTLASKWANGKVKLDKCINAAFQPKQSTADENCQGFLSQLTNYRSSIPATTPTRDIANRTAELATRVDVIKHVFNTRTLPSMTTAGFCREHNTCPAP